MPRASDERGDGEVPRPGWFAAFIADRGTRKPSTHTMKAYRQDFDAIAALIVDGPPGDYSRMSLATLRLTQCVRRSRATPRPTRRLRSSDAGPHGTSCARSFTRRS